MPVGLVHTIELERFTAGGDDEYGHPTGAWESIGTVQGLVQPKSVDELNQANQGGPVISDSSIYLPAATDVHESDRLSYRGELYDIDGIERRDYGKLTHLKVNATKVAA